MSTRAMYTFKDEYETVHVYKHCDGYPEGGLSWIANARNYAWQLPRFEPDDFASAFVAANKTRFDPKAEYPVHAGGNVRLCNTSIQEPWQMASDAQYHYVVYLRGGMLWVEIHEVNWWDDDPAKHESERLFSGPLNDALTKFKAKWVEPLDNKPQAA